MFTRTKCFFAASMPLRIACGTSLALPEPKPTTPAEASPTTTSAANDMFLPPLTTLVTRLIETTWSFRLNCPASSFFFIIAIHSLFLGLLRDQFAHFLCRRDVAARLQLRRKAGC